GGSSATVRGLASGAPWEERVTGAVVDNPALRAVWARAHLRELEDRYAMGERELEQEIVRVSLDNGVLCRFTAYVAADTRQVAEGGPEHRGTRPVERPAGGSTPASPMAFGLAAMSSPAPAPDTFTGIAPAGGFAALLGGEDAAAPRMARGPMFARPAPAPRAMRSLDTVKPQLVAELDRLKVLPAPDAIYLADLGSRLATLSAYLGGHTELAALARELEEAGRPGADLGALMRRAVEVLTSLTGSSGPGEGGGQRRPFWKRA